MSAYADAAALIQSLFNLSSEASVTSDEKARKEALRLSKAITTTLEDPVNRATELAFSPFISMSARIAVDLNLFLHIDTSKGPITAAKLADLSGGEELLIVRILRPLSAIGFVKEVAVQTWVSNPVTKAMATKGVAAGHKFVSELLVSTAAKTPRFLNEYGHRCPTDPRDGTLQYAFQTKLQMFEYLSTLPEVQTSFNTFMGNTMGSRNYWVDWYPVGENLLNGAKSDTALVVDIGGGKGHDLIAFQEKFPQKQSGSLILQDLRHVLDAAEDLNPAIDKMEYDFFTEQPVQGARAYFYHHILHDWSDSRCLDILARVRQAMVPVYSRLLIHELILPDVGASSFQSMLDLTMMAFNSGMERSQQQWNTLLEGAGFEVVRFWLPEDDGDGIVEAIVKEGK